jgi:hypothetical protein
MLPRTTETQQALSKNRRQRKFCDESELYKREGDSSLHLFFPDPMLLMAIAKYHYRRRKIQASI